MKLTSANIANLTLPQDKSDNIWFDDDVAGFGLRMRIGGKPSWVFQYRIGARQRRLTLGAVSALSAAIARDRAIQLYAQIRRGEDPAGAKAKAATSIDETFGAALDVYLKRQAERLRARSLIEVRRHLSVHCKPLHRLPLAEIDRRAISRLLSSIADTSGPVTANRVGSSIAAMFAFYIREGWVDANPAATLNKRHEEPRSRVLTDTELRQIWAATSGGTDQYSSIVRMLLLTGCRREEIGGLTWSEIDLGAATITLPPERTKNKREHVIPLSPLALSIIQAQSRREGRDHVFGEGGQHGYKGWSAGKKAMDARAKIAPKFVIHDLRRTFSTRLNGEGIAPPHIVERLLGHHQGGISAVYNKAQYLNEKRMALDLWAERVAAIIEERAAKVVPLRA